jgi:hypothetical protein
MQMVPFDVQTVEKFDAAIQQVEAAIGLGAIRATWSFAK